jgi:hypothetical protein
VLLSHRTNPPLYPQWQEYFRKYQPHTLIVWGKNDDIFPAEGAYPYKRDLQTLEFHLLDTADPQSEPAATTSAVLSA